jgi:hypothetical protein
LFDQGGIHEIDLGSKVVTGYVSFQFEGWCKQVVVDTEHFQGQEDVFWLFKSVKLLLSANPGNFIQDQLFEFRISYGLIRRQFLA